MATDNADDLVLSISTDQATLRRSIQRIEGDIAKLAGGVQKSFAPVGKAIEDAISTPLQQRIQAMIGIGKQASKEWTGALADQGAELERLRAKYNPLFATVNRYKDTISEIRRAHALGAIGSAEYAAAMSRERVAALASIAAIKGRNQALADTPVPHAALDSNAQFRRQNLGYQAFDIGQGLAGGMPIGMILAQQGPQIAQMYAGAGGLKAALSDVVGIAGSVVRAIGPIGIALAAAGTAAGAYFLMMDDGTEKANEDFKKHVDLIRAAAQQWGDALPSLKEYIDQLDRGANLKSAQEATEALVKQSFADLPSKMNSLTSTFTAATRSLDQVPIDLDQYRELLSSFANLKKDVADNTVTMADLDRVQKALAASLASASTPELKKFGTVWEQVTVAIRQAADEARKANDDFAKLSGLTANQVQDLIHNRGSGFRQLPVEGPVPEFRPNVELEGLPTDKEASGTSANEKASTSYRDLIKSADDRLGQMKLEIDLLGKFGIEAETARFKLELLQNAEDKGRSLSAEQRKELEQKVETFRQYSDMLAKVKLQQDLMEDRRMSLLTPQDRQIATTLKQYGLSTDDLNSPQAQAIRQSLQYGEVKDGVKTFLTDLQNGLVSSGGDVGKALGMAVLNAVNNQLQKQLDAIFDRLASSVANAIVGAPAASPTTTAANTVISSVNDNAAALATKIAPTLRADGLVNVPPASNVASVASTVAGTDVQSQVWNHFASKGLPPHQIAGIMGNMQWESRFNPGIAGDNGHALGLSQWNDRGPAMKAFVGSDWKTDVNGQLAFMDKELGGTESAAWAKLRASKNVTESTAAFASYERPRGWSPANPMGADHWGDRLKMANENLAKFGQTTSKATNDVGTFSGSLGAIGQKVTGAAAGFDWSSLFSSSWKPNTTFSAFLGLAGGGHVRGAGGPTDDSVPAWLSNGEFVVNAGMTRKHRALLEAINNGKVGRFADGGIVAPSLVPVPVAPTLISGAAAAVANNNQPGILHVHLDGANGDEHVRSLAKQAVTDGLKDYNVHQERGGHGTVQAKWASRKG